MAEKRFRPLHIIFLAGIVMIFVTVQTWAINHVTCEDGENFQLEEQIAADSHNLPLASKDKIIVDTKQLRLYFYRDQVLFKTYTVAIGTKDTPTPIGEWRIIHKGGNWGDGFGARWIGINVPWGIYGIHGTNKPGTIGYRSSHGCIRMFNQHVIELYNIVKVGTPVIILGDPPVVTPRAEFRLKSSGKDVSMVQFAMRRQGFNPGNLDGRFGATMEQAVKRLQFFYGLTPSGRLTMVEQYLLGLR